MLITGKTLKEVKMLGNAYVRDFNYDITAHDKLLWGFLYKNVCENYQFRRHKLRFIFEDSTCLECDVRLAIINLIFWRPYIETKKMITPNTLLNPRSSKMTIDGFIASQMNVIVDEFRHIMPIEMLCNVGSWILEQLGRIARDFCIHIGNTISMRSIIDLANNNPEFDDLIHTEYDENMKMNEIELDLIDKSQRVINIIMESGTSDLHPFIGAGGNINPGQLRQCIICIGPRSDTQGTIAPMIVNTNFIRGLRTVSDYYLESFSSRKSLIANKFQMSVSGYDSRVMNLSVVDSHLVNYEDCGTTHYLTINVHSMKTLELLRYKYMFVGYINGRPSYHEICPEHDVGLIGKTINIRSHIYCTLPEGSYCKTCYGGLSYYILGYYHSGLIATSSLSEPIGQKILSTKHLIITLTKTINWPIQMLKYFKCTSDAISPLPSICVNTCYIGLYNEDVEEIINVYDMEGVMDDEEEITITPMMDYIHRFILVCDGVQIDFEIPDVNLYMSEDFIYKIIKASKTSSPNLKNISRANSSIPIQNEVIFVSLGDWQSDEAIFNIGIENTELGAYLKKLETLLGIRAKTNYTSIEEFMSLLVKFIEDMNIDFSFAHIESIIYSLVRDSNNLIHRPDFKKDNPAYTILPMSKSILMSGYLSTSLAFERIMDQLKSVNTYQKMGKGFLDPFFR